MLGIKQSNAVYKKIDNCYENFIKMERIYLKSVILKTLLARYLCYFYHIVKVSVNICVCAKWQDK